MIEEMEIIPIASDHAGFRLKGRLIASIREMGASDLDLGTDSEDSESVPRAKIGKAQG